MNVICGEAKFPPGTKVLIKGERDFHAGQEGEVVRVDGRYSFWVRIGKDIFRKAGRNLKALEPVAEIPPERKKGRENLSKIIAQSYKKLKTKDPAFAAYVDRSNPRLR